MQAIDNPIVFEIGKEAIRRLRDKGPPEKLEELALKFPEYEKTLLRWRDEIKRKIASSSQAG